MAEQSVVHVPGNNKEIGKCSIATFLRIKPVLGAKKVPSSTGVQYNIRFDILKSTTCCITETNSCIRSCSQCTK